MNKFLIVGSGRRVQQDIIPVLEYIGCKNKDISVYATREKKILVRDSIYDVFNFEKLKYIENDTIVYIAVPAAALRSVIELVLELNSSVKLIVDTPINSATVVNRFRGYNISVAEDAFFLGKYLLDSNLIHKNFSLLTFYKSAMSYHGVAFIEVLLSQILLSFSLFGLYIAICKKGVAIIFGKKNYEKGNIWLNTSQLEFPLLSQREKELIGGLSNRDSVSSRFLDLKRIGLVYLINAVISNSSETIALSDGYRHFKKSKSINVYIFENIKKYLKKALLK